MMDTTQIPESELLNDLSESIADIDVCKHAIKIGVTQYSGGSVQDRLEANQEIVAKIRAELARRKITTIVVGARSDRHE